MLPTMAPDDTKRSGIRCARVPESGRGAWDDWVSGSPSGHMHQCFWWASPLQAYGMTPEVVAAWNGDALVGGNLFRCTKVPRLPFQLVESLDGPAFEGWQPSFASPYAEAVAAFARETRALSVVFQGCPDPAIHRDLVEAFRLLEGDVVLSQGPTEASLPLDGQTSESLSSGFSHGVRSSIKKGRRNGVSVARLETAADLRAAYDAWMATARRKGFASVRPWEALLPVLQHSVSSGKGVVFGAVMDGTVIAAIYVSYVGQAAAYVYGGHLDGAERYSAAHLLQVAAIDEAIAREFPEYSFGVLPAGGNPEKSGIDRFKLSFGAVPRPTLDTITWRRRIILHEGLVRLRRHRAGAWIERAIRRRAVARGLDD